MWVTRIGFACLSLESRCGTPDRAALPDYVAFLSHVQLKGAISYSVRLSKIESVTQTLRSQN